MLGLGIPAPSPLLHVGAGVALLVGSGMRKRAAVCLWVPQSAVAGRTPVVRALLVAVVVVVPPPLPLRVRAALLSTLLVLLLVMRLAVATAVRLGAVRLAEAAGLRLPPRKPQGLGAASLRTCMCMC